jgi:hypothetical protein
MITGEYLLLSGDMDISDIEIKFNMDEIEQARTKKQEWKKDEKIFNVVLWKVTITKEII